ncbi:MAG TPA: SDR family NAD(P)-dependent oxidoreductase [Gammaproteobacteria bacterium]|nr:SDR family NAD(P)-dependent oxidoreductase [Gammaproteobacteria bacterium]
MRSLAGRGRRPKARYAAVAALLAVGAAPALALAETVLITGANSGIGLEFTKQYAAKGWTVIATHRRSGVPETLAKVVAEFPKVSVESLDVTNVAQAKALAAKLADTPIDVLINNAGVYNDRSKCAAGDDACVGDYKTQTFGNLDFALLDTIMAVNVKGPLIVSQAFYENVKASKLKKIVAISSSNGTITGELPHPWPGATFYRTSKAALNREMQIVATSVMRDGVTVVMFNPGPTLTEHQEYLRGNSMMIETSFTVGHMIDTIAKVTIDDSGKFLRYDGVPEKW